MVLKKSIYQVSAYYYAEYTKNPRKAYYINTFLKLDLII